MSKIEETSQIKSVEFDELFDLQKRLAEFKDQDIEKILDDALNRDRNQLFNRRVLWVNLRHTTQKEHNQTNKERVDNIRQLHGIALHGLSALAGVFSAFSGPTTMVGGLMQLASQAASKTGEYKKELSQGTNVLKQHTYESLSSIKQEQMQQAQSFDREHKQTASRIEQTLASHQRLFELLANSGV